MFLMFRYLCRGSTIAIREMSKGLVRKLTVVKLGSSLFGRRNDKSAIIPVSLNPELR